VPETQPNITLDSGQDGTFVTGQIGFGTNREGTNVQLGLGLRTPFDPNNSNKEVGFLNLDGLTTGTSATLSLSLQGELPPIGQGATLRSICRDANDAIRDSFQGPQALDPDAVNVKACTQEEIQKDSLLDNEVEAEQTKALWGMCQDINKKKGVGLLAPPGSSLADFPGYSSVCSLQTLISAQAADLRKSLRDKARASAIETLGEQTTEGSSLEAAIDRALPAVITDACSELNKNRARNRIGGSSPSKLDPLDPPIFVGPCSSDSLATAAVMEELGTKQMAAAQLACQKRLAIPSEAPFITGKSALNNCFLTTLLDFAATTTNPAFWERRILRAIPVTLWYVTLKGTQVDQTFKFLQVDEHQMLMDAKPVHENSSSTGINASLFTRGLLFTLGADHQKRFTAASPSQICTPIPNTDGLSCRQAALKGPNRDDMDLVHAEVKTLFGIGGLTFRTIYDNHDHNWEHHVVLHFLRNPKEGLNGGIDLQYNTDPVAAGVATSKDSHFTARLFVGTKFNLPFLPGSPPSSTP
jgi:hypothetical protein